MTCIATGLGAVQAVGPDRNAGSAAIIGVQEVSREACLALVGGVVPIAAYTGYIAEEVDEVTVYGLLVGSQSCIQAVGVGLMSQVEVDGRDPCCLLLYPPDSKEEDLIVKMVSKRRAGCGCE